MSESRESPKKHWVFTLNNPSANDDAGLWLLPYEYAVLGNEVGESGTPHIQGYVVFKKKYRLTQLKAHSPQGHRCHWEPQSQYSTPLQASEYCKKEGRFKEFGELPEAGHNKGGTATKQKWVDALDLAKRGKFEEIDAHIQIQYHTSLRKIHHEALLAQAQLDGDLENLWYFGPPGTGKSRKARDKFPDAYFKACNHWWDGYAGEATVIIDEWEIDTGKYIGHHLKIWADRYPFKMEIKGSSLPPQRPKRIVITTNYSIDECFGRDRMLCDAIKRRFIVVDFEQFPYTKPDGTIVEEVD